VVRRGKRLAQVIHGIFQAAYLLRQRLERNGGIGGMLVRGSLRDGAARSREKDECGSGLHLKALQVYGN
jgi:Na+/alanine symporter